MTELRQRLIEELKLLGRSPRTIESYVAAVAELATFHGRSPARLDNEQIRQFVLHLIEVTKCSESTVNVKVSGLKFFYRAVLGRELPVLAKRPKTARRPPVVLNQSEVARLLGTVRNTRERTALTAGYACGLRLSEILALRIDHIDSERMTLTVVVGKGKKGRVLPLSRWFLDILRVYWWAERPETWLFPSRRTERAIHPTTLQRAFKAARVSAGIEKQASIHTLRHSFATHLLDEGVPIRVVQQLLGHRSLNTTMRYLHFTGKSRDRLQGALEVMGETLAPAL